MIIKDRSIDTSSFPNIDGDVPFFIVEKGERSSVCKPEPEAYVVDTQSDWDAIAGKIRSDCQGNIRDSPLPNIDFKDNSVLVYFWGQKPNQVNSFSIINVKVDPNASSVLVNLEFENGVAEALSYPYIIATIPKSAYRRFVFAEQEGKN